MKSDNKLKRIDSIVKDTENRMLAQDEGVNQHFKLVHTMRAVVIIIDVTKSMAMKDFKPSRLAVAVKAVQQFLTYFKQLTPIALAGVATSNQGCCHMLTGMTYNFAQIFDKMSDLEVEASPGSFSFESSLYRAIVSLDKFPAVFHREILLIQSSPMTKDQHDLSPTIKLLKDAEVRLNVLSLCGWTEVIKRSVQTLKGKYETVHKEEQLVKKIKELARPSIFEPHSVKTEFVKMGLVRKEQSKKSKYCICHFKQCRTTYICVSCESTLCKEPPLQCPICGILLIMPTDLFNHTIS